MFIMDVFKLNMVWMICCWSCSFWKLEINCFIINKCLEVWIVIGENIILNFVFDCLNFWIERVL